MSAPAIVRLPEEVGEGWEFAGPADGLDGCQGAVWARCTQDLMHERPPRIGCRRGWSLGSELHEASIGVGQDDGDGVCLCPCGRNQKVLSTCADEELQTAVAEPIRRLRI